MPRPAELCVLEDSEHRECGPTLGLEIERQRRREEGA